MPNRTSRTLPQQILPNETIQNARDCPMIRLLSVVGARPNFMKIAPILDELKRNNRSKENIAMEYFLVHSGQHYDESLSGSFFSELGLPTPDVNLEVGSASQAAQTAEVMKRIEPILLNYRPHMMLVVGDVNSTLAAALTAVKLGIAVAHVEAGLRSFDNAMPEEVNRKLTDAVSTLLFVTEQSGVDNLKREGVPAERIFFVGNVMIDCLLKHRQLAARSTILDRIGMHMQGSQYRPYGVLTLHRPSNVDHAETLRGILKAACELSKQLPIFFPIHPRTRKNIDQFACAEYLNFQPDANHGIVPLAPLGYLDFLSLNDHARLVLTDSGGVQEETTALGVPCLTLRENTERPATVEYGSNQVIGIDPDRILAAALAVLKKSERHLTRPPLWDGQAASRIVAILRQHFQLESA